MGLSLSTILPCMKKKKKEPPSTLFPSIPNDIVLNILSRISRIHYPSLSLVSKTFKSLLVSPELEATRSLLGVKPEDDCIYVCLRIPKIYRCYPTPCWFSVRPSPNQKWIPIPPFPDKLPAFPTVVSISSKICVIGGFLNDRSTKVFLLDCTSHQWHILPEMHVPRGNAAAGLLDGKIYVVGGSEPNDEENWGEVYDPKSQTWTTLQTTVPDLSIREAFAHDVIMDDTRVYMFQTKFCLLVKDNILCKASSAHQCLMWCDLKEKLVWRKIKGLGLLPFTQKFMSLANTSGDDGGRELSVSWSSFELRPNLKHTTELWCAHILIERCGLNEVWGVVCYFSLCTLLLVTHLLSRNKLQPFRLGFP